MGMIGVAMGVSAISSIGTTYSQSQAIKSEGAYKKSIADTNARIANLEATQTLEAGDELASRSNVKTRTNVGAIRAIQGASGIDVNSGSSALTRIGSDFAGKIDELTIRNNAARKAWGLRVQAINDSFAGQMYKMTAASQTQQTLLTGGLKAINGPLSIYSNYKKRIGSGTDDLPFDLSTDSGVPIGQV